MKKKSVIPAWVHEYTKSMHQAFVGMTPSDWGPLDFNECYRLLNGAFIQKIHQTVTILKKKKVPIKEIAEAFLSPSAFRAAFYFAVNEYALSDHKKRKEAREVFDFFHKILDTIFIRDLWARRENVVHDEREVARMMREHPWVNADEDIARLVARLGNSASALAYALYRDYYVTESQEVYGPYDVEKHSGADHILIIKHYPKLRPVALWSNLKGFKHADLKIYLVYEGINMSCEFIGMHTRYTGDLMTSLRRFAVEIDGEFQNDTRTIKEKTNHFARLAVSHSKRYDAMHKEALKMKFLEWVCWSLRPLFELAGTDPKPTKKMIINLKGKPVADRIVMGPMVSYKEYLKHLGWDAYWLRDLYKKR